MLTRRGWLWGAAAVAAGSGLAPRAARGHGGDPVPAPALQPLAPQVWWVPAHDGESTAANRGHVTHALAARDGSRLWLVGTGPSPRFGQALAGALRAAAGAVVTDIVNPWAHPEAVLGNPAFPSARRWAHEGVAWAMAQQCSRCVTRLQDRLGASAGDVGPDAVVLPDHLLTGDHGHLGPFDWWCWRRAPAMPVTAWWHAGARVLMAPGLVWVGAPPDLRDADLAVVDEALAALQTVVRRLASGGALTVVGEQGPLGTPTAVDDTAAYLGALRRTVARAQDRGAAETDRPPPLEGVPDTWSRHPRHALNWQRAWRQAEADSFSRPLPR